MVHLMQNYNCYPQWYAPDVARASLEVLPDSTAENQHFRVMLELVQTTVWFKVAIQVIYNTHYLLLNDQEFETISKSVSIREYKDASNLSAGAYPAGEAHGFLWRTDSWWHTRGRGDGVDVEITNISLTRPVPFGFGWWASGKAKGTIRKLLARTDRAVRDRRSTQGCGGGIADIGALDRYSRARQLGCSATHVATPVQTLGLKI